MPVLHTSALTRYVDDANAAPGGYQDPEIVARYEPLELAFDTIVDQSLSPYSDAYVSQQMNLYREIAGRDLDQEQGELHADDVTSLRRAPNPTGIPDAAVLAEYVRCVARCWLYPASARVRQSSTWARGTGSGPRSSPTPAALFMRSISILALAR